MNRVEITPIFAGQLATMEIDGGFQRRPVPSDGLLIETDVTTVHLDAASVAEALRKLGWTVKPPKGTQP